MMTLPSALSPDPRACLRARCVLAGLLVSGSAVVPVPADTHRAAADGRTATVAGRLVLASHGPRSRPVGYPCSTLPAERHSGRSCASGRRCPNPVRQRARVPPRGLVVRGEAARDFATDSGAEGFDLAQVCTLQTVRWRPCDRRLLCEPCS